jgi:cytochrome c oxidase cbb3-type subunit 3
MLLLFCVNFLSAQGVAPAGDKPFQLPIRLDVLIGAFVLGIELMVVLWLLLKINSLLAEISDEKEKSFSFNIHMPLIFDKLNASVAIEKEKDILLDHNYDGIHELDNNLPPWWKYSFYLSIIWAIFYLGYFYFGGGPSSHDEYIAEVQQARIDVDAYNKKNALNVDESHVKIADAAGITDGQDIFKTNCAACHGNNGEGNVGPNLTDDYWLHGGSLNDLFKTVKYGWPAKGMKSWESDLSAVQIRNVISYIHTLHGTNPANAKAPQGELFNDGTTAGDSTAVMPIDSSAIAATDTTKK